MIHLFTECARNGAKCGPQLETGAAESGAPSQSSVNYSFGSSVSGGADLLSSINGVASTIVTGIQNKEGRKLQERQIESQEKLNRDIMKRQDNAVLRGTIDAISAGKNPYGDSTPQQVASPSDSLQTPISPDMSLYDNAGGKLFGDLSQSIEGYRQAQLREDANIDSICSKSYDEAVTRATDEYIRNSELLQSANRDFAGSISKMSSNEQIVTASVKNQSDRLVEKVAKNGVSRETYNKFFIEGTLENETDTTTTDSTTETKDDSDIVHLGVGGFFDYLIDSSAGDRTTLDERKLDRDAAKTEWKETFKPTLKDKKTGKPTDYKWIPDNERKKDWQKGEESGTSNKKENSKNKRHRAKGHIEGDDYFESIEKDIDTHLQSTSTTGKELNKSTTNIAEGKTDRVYLDKSELKRFYESAVAYYEGKELTKNASMEQTFSDDSYRRFMSHYSEVYANYLDSYHYRNDLRTDSGRLRYWHNTANMLHLRRNRNFLH